MEDPLLYTRSRALIIGASEYRNPRWSPLPGVANDLKEVGAALEEHGFETIEVRNPDHGALEEAFDNFLKDGSIEPRHRLLVYYAGHGCTRETPQGLRRGYLVPVDAPEPEARDFRLHALALDRIHEYARGSPADHILFLFDSCFSGELLERHSLRNGVPPLYIHDRAMKPVRQFITSGQWDEPVLDSSQFCRGFVEALRGAADEDNDGYFTAFQLADFLSKFVVKNTRQEQHPQYGKSQDVALRQGDFVFIVPPQWGARRAEVPEPPSERPSFEGLEQVAAELEPHYKTRNEQWRRWLEDMERDFEGCVDFEKRQLPTHVKIRYWRHFLGGYSADSPFAPRASELRTEAEGRIEALKLAEERAEMPKGARKFGEVREETPLRMRFRSVIAGRYLMGSPDGESGRNPDETQHAVRLTRGFWIGETVVTQGQWQALMGGTTPSHFASLGEDFPVERVNWYAALAFANRLSESSGLEPCYELEGYTESRDGGGPRCDRVLFRGLDCFGYRLPTEAEWEYAARAGRETPFWNGEDLTSEQANYDGNFSYREGSHGDFRQETTSVRAFAPNPWGLYDVHGNVAEWVWDIHADYPPGEAIDPIGPEQSGDKSFEDTPRVIRGGGWFDEAAGCRAADRLPAVPGYRDSNVGFRLVRSFRQSARARDN